LSQPTGGLSFSPAACKRCSHKNFPANAYEIIIVDDGPEDSATQNLVAGMAAAPAKQLCPSYTPAESNEIPVTGYRWANADGNCLPGVHSQPAQFPRLLYLPAVHTSGPAAARNLGWRSASGDIIAFTDDDCLPDSNWLATVFLLLVKMWPLSAGA
jgi:glycosyltransferase involved in cell wall biosynthesis